LIHVQRLPSLAKGLSGNSSLLALTRSGAFLGLNVCEVPSICPAHKGGRGLRGFGSVPAAEGVLIVGGAVTASVEVAAVTACTREGAGPLGLDAESQPAERASSASHVLEFEIE
jgi:hypothetical protein